MKILKNIFASLFGTPKKVVVNERTKKLEATMQYIFNEITAAMEIDPIIATYHDDELILKVAQVLYDIRTLPDNNQIQQSMSKPPPVVTQKKVRTYH